MFLTAGAISGSARPVFDSGRRLVSAAQGTSYGHYWTRPYDRSDAAASLIAYRMVEEYPLLVAAAIPGKRVFAGQAHTARRCH